jgi:uncharacterized membrane protein
MRDNRSQNPNRDRTSKPNTRRPNNRQYDRPAQNMLPPSRTLESYESIAPGSVNKLLEMAKKEQEHRHSWQDKYIKSHNFSYRTGQFFGLIYNLALLGLIFTLINNGDKELAVKLLTINAVLIFLALIVTTTERKLVARKPPRRGGNNRIDSRKPTPKK